MRWIINKVHRNVKKKTKSESLAALEEALFKAQQEGNKRASDALKKTIKILKNKKGSDMLPLT